MIHCGDFILRPVERKDKKAMSSLANNYKIWRNVRDVFPHPYTLKDADEFIRRIMQNNKHSMLCIDYKNEFAGMIGFTEQQDVYARSAEIGYWLGEPFWGKGIMTTAVKKFTAYIFATTDIVRIYAGVFEWNQGSQKVLEKAGFEKEGISRKAIFKDGCLIDEYRYALVK